jgi:hypothetical protein
MKRARAQTATCLSEIKRTLRGMGLTTRARMMKTTPSTSLLLIKISISMRMTCVTGCASWKKRWQS